MKNRMRSIREAYAHLFDDNNSTAYEAMKILLRVSESSNSVYKYMDNFIKMMDDKNPYIRLRGIELIAHNAKWDIYRKIDTASDCLLSHITDTSPLVARQCIILLPMIAKHKQNLKKKMINILKSSNITAVSHDMQYLLYNEVFEVLRQLND